MGSNNREGSPHDAWARSLRPRSEDRLNNAGGQISQGLGDMTPEEAQQMLHELQVHQVELEMQNEELRRIQAELTAERERYADLYDQAPVGYLTLSSEGLIQEINLTAAALLGIPRSTLRNIPLSRFICREDQDIYHLNRRRLMETREPQEFELRLVRNDGTAFWVRIKTVATQDAAGQSVFRVVMNDVTLYKAAEEALSRTQEEAAAALSAKSRLAVLQSQIRPHFLYNALSAIISLCYTDGERAGALLTTFSRFLRIVFSANTAEDTGTLQRELELVEAYTAVEKARFGERLNFSFNVDEGLMDERIIPLVLQPLVENAICHGLAQKPEGGTVRLRIRRCGRLMKVTVCDDGVGMAQDRVRAILERQNTDAGVGIANINQRLHLHFGSSLRIRSAAGVGTVVVFYLPLSTDEAEVR